MFKAIQEKIYTPDKFYDVFLGSEEGKKSFDHAYQQFTLPKDIEAFINYIINSMQDWLFEQLTDDEMNSAYTLFQSLEPDLRQLLLSSIH